MSITTTTRQAFVIAAMLAGFGTAGGAAVAGPAPTPKAFASSDMPSSVQDVRHRRRGGVSIYIGPGYGYYPSYGYADYGYYPRYRSYSRYSYYDDGYYDRPYRRHNRRWAKERFEHPLGRR